MELQKIKLQMIKEGKPIFTLEQITSPEEIVELINTYERYDLSPTQKIIVIGLDNKNKISIYSEIASGVPEYANFKMSEIFKVLLVANCNKFILVQTRPSGDVTPSTIDIETNEEIKKASKIMQIKFLDQIIIGDGEYHSINGEYRKALK